jgi:hypothetical protein
MHSRYMRELFVLDFSKLMLRYIDYCAEIQNAQTSVRSKHFIVVNHFIAVNYFIAVNDIG